MSSKDAQKALDDGDVEKAISKGQEALKKASTTADKVAAVTVLSTAFLANDDTDAAAEVVNDQLTAVKGKDKKGEAALMAQKAEVCLEQRKFDEAMEAAQDAQAQARKLGDSELECRALIVSVNSQLQKKAGTAALKSANNVLALAQQSGEKESEAAAWLGIAKVHLMKDDEENSMLDVLGAAEKAADIYSSASSKTGEAEAKGVIASAQLKLGNVDEALAAAESSFKLWNGTGNSKKTMAALDLLIQAFSADGKPGEGLSAAKQYEDDCSGKNKKAQAGALQALSTAHIHGGDFVEAFRTAKAARGLYREAEDGLGEAWTTLTIADVQRAQGQKLESMRSAEEAMSAFKNLGSIEGIEWVNHTLSEIYVSIGQVQKAPDRKKALQYLKDMNKAVENRDLEAFKAARRKAESMDKLLLEYDMMDALAPAFDMDQEGATEFLKEQGYTFEKEKTGEQHMKHYDHQTLYAYFRVSGGMGFGPQFRSTHPFRVGTPGVDSIALSSSQLPETEDWEMKMGFRPGLLDSGLQVGACQGFS